MPSAFGKSLSRRPHGIGCVVLAAAAMLGPGLAQISWAEPRDETPTANDAPANEAPANDAPAAAPQTQTRPPAAEDDLRYWLQNMVGYHRFSLQEASLVTGLSPDDVQSALNRFQIQPGQWPTANGGTSTLTLLPYPGGRHPRIGFLDGAIDPQRETKFSVFTPWDHASYVVVDLPEALWSNLGLTYLAHTHVPTVWNKANITLPQQEWERLNDGRLRCTRKLPNGIAFTALAQPMGDHVQMQLTLTNGTREMLSDLRVQNCVMLKGAPEFAQQTNDNKVFRQPYVCCKSSLADRWVITAWEPCDRAWGNAPCPCLHSDPKFPDCAPGETQHLRGWLSFYLGNDLDTELARLDATGWKSAPLWEQAVQ